MKLYKSCSQRTFLKKISSKKLPGQTADDDMENFWKNYSFVTDRIETKDYTGIKDGFGSHYVRKYLIPHLQDISGPLKRVFSDDKTSSKLYLAIKNYPFTGGEDPQEYALSSNLEIAVQDIASLVYDWSLSYKGSSKWAHRKGAVHWLFSEIMENPDKWGVREGRGDGLRAIELQDWMEIIEEMVEKNESTSFTPQAKAYHTLVRADVMMVRDVFDTFYNWKNESEGKWLFDEKEDEQLMDRLFSELIILTDRIDKELKGERKSAGIKKYINFDAGERGNPREETSIRSIEEEALIDTWFGKLWAVTWYLSDQNAFKWSRIWRALGIDGIVDLGSGVIHSSEPTQAVFFAIDSVEHVKSFVNKSKPDDLQTRGKTRRSAGKFRESSFALARKIFKKRLPQEYHQRLHSLARAYMVSGEHGTQGALVPC